MFIQKEGQYIKNIILIPSALDAGTYLVRVYNYGTIIPLYQYSNINNAYIKVNFRLKVFYDF